MLLSHSLISNFFFSRLWSNYLLIPLENISEYCVVLILKDLLFYLYAVKATNLISNTGNT